MFKFMNFNFHAWTNHLEGWKWKRISYGSVLSLVLIEHRSTSKKALKEKPLHGESFHPPRPL